MKEPIPVWQVVVWFVEYDEETRVELVSGNQPRHKSNISGTTISAKHGFLVSFLQIIKQTRRRRADRDRHRQYSPYLSESMKSVCVCVFLRLKGRDEISQSFWDHKCNKTGPSIGGIDDYYEFTAVDPHSWRNNDKQFPSYLPASIMG